MITRKTEALRIITVVLLAGLAAGPAGDAAEYVVDQAHPEASDKNPGTAMRPLTTIRAADGLVAPGDTVIVRRGIYRETAAIRKHGEAGKPITVKAADGERVVLTAADRITGWRPCSRDDVGDHPHRDKLFVAEVDWLNERLVSAGRFRIYEAGRRMQVARTPDAGWWGITKGLSLSEFTDEAHLAQANADAWDGWTVAILEQAGGGVIHIPVKAFDPATHKITMARDYSRYRKIINEKRDRYYMENHLSALDGPGQFVYRKQGKVVRLVVWPSTLGEDGQPTIEAPRRSHAFYIRGGAHLAIDGLEICYSTGHGVGMSGSGPPVAVTVQNCYIHDNLSYGIEMRKPVRCTIRRNIIRENGMGVVIGGAQDCVVEENDIGWNHGDGVVAPGGTRGLVIQRNYIHNHWLWGHPDNIQFWNDVQGTVIRDNVLLNAGQTMMSAGMEDTKLINNVWLGSRAVSMICGGDSWDIRSNTICATGPMPTGYGGKGFTLRNNIIAPLHGIPLYGMRDPASFDGDYNILWAGPDYRGALVVKGRWKDSAASLEQIREKFGQERHGLVAAPEFRRAAKAFTVTDYRRTAECTASKFFLAGRAASMFAVGDHVEVSFDGVVRKVVETGPDFVVLDQPFDAPPITGMSLANWGDQSDFRWDLRPAEGSPAIRAGEGGCNIGCNLDIQAYIRGDFDGDGKRDLPEMPE